MHFAFCGIDGSGKTTLINNIYNKIYKDFSVYISKIKLNSLEVFSALSQKEYGDIYAYYNNISPDLIRLGVSIDFAHHYIKYKKIFEKYDIILCDRFALCYQAYGLAYGVQDTVLINRIFNLIEEPNLYFYLDLNPQLAIDRLKKRGNYIEEEENFNLMSKVRDKYELLIRDKKNVVRIDATKSQIEITDLVIKSIKHYYTKKRGI